MVNDVNGNKVFVHDSRLDFLEGEFSIPEGVTSIDDGAFYGCKDLTKINIPESVTSIGDDAFGECKGLTEMNIPEGVISIGKDAFRECEGLKKINIPKNVISISDGTFSRCQSLTEINIPKGVISIGKNVFFKCEGLTDITIPEGVTSIGDAAFYGCKGLKEISIPEGLISVGDWTFNRCEGLKEINIPEGLISIGDGAFHGCGGLKKINIPESVTSIGDEAFSGCSKLKEISIPAGVTSIGNTTFDRCEGLTKINLPKGLISIGEDAFSGCRGLKEISIPEGVTSIGYAAFIECKGLTEINIPDGVISIDNYAFRGCEGLKKINIPESLTSIGDCAFEGVQTFNSLRYDEENKKFIYERLEKLTKNNKYIPIIYFRALTWNRKSREFIKSSDFRAFNSNIPNLAKFLESQPEEEQLDFFKFAVGIGCFSTEKILDKNGQETEVTVGQKASAILARLLKTDVLELGQYHALFDSVPYDAKVSLEFLEFISPQGKKNDNLELLSRMEHIYPGIFSKTMVYFNKIKELRTTLSEDGRTVVLSWEEVIEKFYLQNKYKNIVEGTEDIVEAYVSKGLDESVYQNGVKLRIQAKQNGVPEHILGKSIQEKTIIEQIEELRQKTGEELNSSKEILEELYKKNFTYEWLSKNDPRNGILGLYVNCCGTITSSFYGGKIAIASVIQKDVQNLVIKDTKGEIVSKGTIYVDEENGYAVFNDFELNQKYREHEQSPGRYSGDLKKGKNLTESERKQRAERDLIFEAFQRGIQAFVEEYDRQHPDNPIKQINVGMGYNRLKRNVEQFEKATKLLHVPGEYMFQDAAKGQHILYKRSKRNRESEISEER